MKLLNLFAVTILSLALAGLSYLQVQKPDIISRDDWGSKAVSGSLPEHEITHITIHHSGVEFSADKDAYQYMRNLQAFSQNDKNWMDIPYHFSIDLEGNIFENRPLQYPGDTNTEYDPTGHALINVIGNYEVQTINPVQLDAIAHLSAWLAQEYNVPVDSIATHKDHSAQTVCPGKDLYQYFENGTMLKKIKEYLQR